jgi:alkanesulfonate monooxygenase SsuD/methylene tetrahydromethanopterin reductase-like flavin-dependent oxidoreductase (luciferase family)
MYADVAAEHGYQAGPENFGYLMGVFVAETDEKAQELGRGFVFGGGANAFSRPEHTLPPGYNSKGAIRLLGKRPGGGWVGLSADRLKQMQTGKSGDEGKNYDEIRQKLQKAYEKAQENLLMIVGSPKTVTEKIKSIVQVLRPGIFTLFQVQGPVGNTDRLNSMRLFAKEVIPPIREFAKQIELTNPFERYPGSVKLTPGTKRLPVVDRTPLKSLKIDTAATGV